MEYNTLLIEELQTALLQIDRIRVDMMFLSLDKD